MSGESESVSASWNAGFSVHCKTVGGSFLFVFAQHRDRERLKELSPQSHIYVHRHEHKSRAEMREFEARASCNAIGGNEIARRNVE